MALANGVYGHASDENELSRPGPDTVIPKFYREKQLNKRKSEDAGRSIYDEYDAMEFIIPGDNTTIHKERVTEEYMRRFPRQWEAYRAGLEQINGMPLESWYVIANHPGLIEEMRALKIRSVEDLAGINDDYATRAPWGIEWRKKAKEEMAKRQSQDAIIAANAELTAKLEAMEKRLAEMEGPAKNKGGRPRKNPEQVAAA